MQSSCISKAWCLLNGISWLATLRVTSQLWTTIQTWVPSWEFLVCKLGLLAKIDDSRTTSQFQQILFISQLDLGETVMTVRTVVTARADVLLSKEQSNLFLEPVWRKRLKFRRLIEEDEKKSKLEFSLNRRQKEFLKIFVLVISNLKNKPRQK